VYRWIEANEPVPPAELSGLTSDGESLFKKNVRWARLTLFKASIVSSREGPGAWTLSTRIYRATRGGGYFRPFFQRPRIVPKILSSAQARRLAEWGC
jgi:hypothetical protein